MPSEGYIATPPSRVWLLGSSSLALICATATAVLFVLPAEFRIDPSGFGRVSGLLNLAGPKVRAASEAAPGEGGTVRRFSQSAYRSDVVEIPLQKLGGS